MPTTNSVSIYFLEKVYLVLIKSFNIFDAAIF